MEFEAVHHFVRPVFKKRNQYEVLFTLKYMAKCPAISVHASTDASVFKLRAHIVMKSDKNLCKVLHPILFYN